MTSSPSSISESSANRSRFFEPGSEHDVLELRRHAGVPGDVGGGLLADLADAARRRVVGRPVAHRPNGGIDDVVRSGKIGLADLEMDDVPTLGLEEPGVGEHLEGALGTQPGQALRETNRHDATIMAGRLPVGSEYSTSTRSTRAWVGPWRSSSSIRSTSARGPSSTVSTAAVRLVPHRARQARVARVADHEGAKPDHLHPCRAQPHGRARTAAAIAARL